MPSSGFSACSSGRRIRKRSAKMSDASASLSTLALRLGQSDLDHLSRVVPFVHRRCGVEALVALQADERAAEGPGQHLGDLGLADAGLAFEKQRATKLQREEDAGGEPAIAEVVVLLEQRDDGVDRPGMRWR